MISSLRWDIMQSRLGVSYRLFGTKLSIFKRQTAHELVMCDP